MWIFQFLYHLYIIKLDVEILVDRLQRAADLYIILEFDSDLMVDQSLEEAVCRGLGSAFDCLSRVARWIRGHKPEEKHL